MNVIGHDNILIDRGARKSIGDSRELMFNVGLGIADEELSAIV
jgi:hypothetical protein